MAHVLKISHDSDVTLTTGAYAVSYTPKEGGSAPTVTETAEVRVIATTHANMLTAIRAINRAFTLAERRRDRGSGTRVYIKIQVSGDSDTYRSELWSSNSAQPLGRVEVLEPTMYLVNNSKYVCKLKLTWTRRNYWEDNAENSLVISNGSGSANDGVAIVNIHGASVFDATTVSFNSTNNRITDLGSGLSMFAVGDVIAITGPASNSGTFTVEEIDGSDGFIDTNEPITTEAADVITNGTFDADSNWTKGDGWTIAAGVANCDGSQTENSWLRQNNKVVIGITYDVTFEISNYNAGNVTPYCGTGGAGTARSANGSHNETITCTTSDDFILIADADFDADVDNVVVLTTTTIYDVGNYVHIDSAAIGGELPAACRIEITSDDAGDSLETCWMGQNVLSGPETFAHVLDASTGDTGTNTADATSASGLKRTYAISDSEAKVEGWTIPTETLTAADGGYFKVFARFAASTNITAVKWRLKILYSGTTIWQGGQVQFDDTYAATVRLIRELDTVQLPPFVPENSNPTDLTFELWGIRDAGAINVDLDCLYLMPLDGYRRLRSLEGLVQNAELIDDGITGTYYQEVSNEQVRDITQAGDQIMLWPNEDNRIYFLLHSLVASKADHNRTGSVIIKYRPRRVSL